MLLIATAALAVPARSEVVIVVSPQSSQAPPIEQVCQVFLGQLKTRKPISLVEPPAIRDEFYSKLCKREPAQVRAIWGKLIFTGNGNPPREVASADEMKKAITADPDSVGYLDSKDVDSSIRVINPGCAGCTDPNGRQRSAPVRKVVQAPRPADDGDRRAEGDMIVSAQSSQAPPVAQECQVFLGKLRTPEPISLVEPPATRGESYSKLCNRNPAETGAIWGKLIFTAPPPREADSADDMKKVVAAEPGSSGDLAPQDVNASSKIIASAN
jgi:hypothetical protein